MKEALHLFGKRKNLNGIATIPVDSSKDPCVVLINAGVVHKVGPFEINVELARFFASIGYLVFRFDFGGLGDSVKVKSSLGHHEAVMQDFKEAFDFLENQFGKSKFIVMGLCTGADHAHKAAVNDDRVVGAVCLDGYGYLTFKYHWLKFKTKLEKWYKVFSVLSRKMAPRKTKNAENKKNNIGLALEEGQYVWELPEKAVYIEEMKQLKERGTKCLYVFSGGVSSYYLYKNQYYDSFRGSDFLSNVDVEYYPKSDHTYKIKKDRNVLKNRIKSWIESSFS